MILKITDVKNYEDFKNNKGFKSSSLNKFIFQSKRFGGDSHYQSHQIWRSILDEINVFIITVKTGATNNFNRYYLVTPSSELNSDKIRRFISITLIDNIDVLIDHLDYRSVLFVYYPDRSKSIHWIEIINGFLLHQLENEEGDKVIMDLEYNSSIELDEIIIKNLRTKTKTNDSTIRDGVNSLNKKLMSIDNEDDEPIRSSGDDNDNDYDQMYRDAYENDDGNVWNND